MSRADWGNKGMRLKDKVAIITGAGDGFAAAIAAGYAKEGAKLYLQEFEDRAGRLAQTVADVRKHSSAVASGVHDITRVEPIKTLVKAVLAPQGEYQSSWPSTAVRPLSSRGLPSPRRQSAAGSTPA